MKTLTEKLTAAIDKSIAQNETIDVTVTCDSGDVLIAIHQIFEGETDYGADGETDYAMADYEGVDTMDIWGWNEETPKDEQDWRLNVRFVTE